MTGTFAITVLLGLSPAFAGQQTPHGDISGSHDTSATGTAVEQIGVPEGGSPVRVEQPVTGSPSRLPRQIRAGVEQTGAIAQLAPADRGQGRVRQLTDAERTAAAGWQLSTGKPSATAAPPLSSPAQGKPEGVAHLKGKDRCDPQSAQANTPACAHAIENRAAEFTRPAPAELTPEQRLLIRQRALANDSTMQSTLRRIGRNDIDPDDPDAQGVASIVLDSAPPPAPIADPTTDAPPDVPNAIVVETIIRALQQ